MSSYGQTIYWRDLRGVTSAVTVDKCTSPKEATTNAIAFAKELGWTPPKWWQFWRWSDTRPIIYEE